MSTNFEFVDSDVAFGCRFATKSGAVFQLEFTEEESKSVNTELDVAGDNGWRGTVSELLTKLEFEGTEVLFDTASRRNELARELENHRFFNDDKVGPMLQARAMELRMEAKMAVRDSLVVIS